MKTRQLDPLELNLKLTLILNNIKKGTVVIEEYALPFDDDEYNEDEFNDICYYFYQQINNLFPTRPELKEIITIDDTYNDAENLNMVMGSGYMDEWSAAVLIIEKWYDNQIPMIKEMIINRFECYRENSIMFKSVFYWKTGCPLEDSEDGKE